MSKRLRGGWRNVRNLWTVVSSLRASPNVCRLRRHSCPRSTSPVGSARKHGAIADGTATAGGHGHWDSQVGVRQRQCEELGKQLALVESASVVTDPAKELVQQKLSAIQSELQSPGGLPSRHSTRLSAVLNLRSLTRYSRIFCAT